jgi:hypothetical protein
MHRHPRHQTKLHGHHDNKIDRTRRRRHYVCVQGRRSSFSFPDNVQPLQNCVTVHVRWWRLHMCVCTTNRTFLCAHLDCRRATLEAPIGRDRNITVRFDEKGEHGRSDLKTICRASQVRVLLMKNTSRSSVSSSFQDFECSHTQCKNNGGPLT